MHCGIELCGWNILFRPDTHDQRRWPTDGPGRCHSLHLIRWNAAVGDEDTGLVLLRPLLSWPGATSSQHVEERSIDSGNGLNCLLPPGVAALLYHHDRFLMDQTAGHGFDSV